VGAAVRRGMADQEPGVRAEARRAYWAFGDTFRLEGETLLLAMEEGSREEERRRVEEGRSSRQSSVGRSRESLAEEGGGHVRRGSMRARRSEEGTVVLRRSSSAVDAAAARRAQVRQQYSAQGRVQAAGLVRRGSLRRPLGETGEIGSTGGTGHPVTPVHRSGSFQQSGTHQRSGSLQRTSSLRRSGSLRQSSVEPESPGLRRGSAPVRSLQSPRLWRRAPEDRGGAGSDRASPRRETPRSRASPLNASIRSLSKHTTPDRELPARSSSPRTSTRTSPSPDRSAGSPDSGISEVVGSRALSLGKLAARVREEQGEQVVAALNLMGRLLEGSWGEGEERVVGQVAAALVCAYGAEETAVRSAALRCLVSLCLQVGEDHLAAHLAPLPGTRRKLLSLHLHRARSGVKGR